MKMNRKIHVACVATVAFLAFIMTSAAFTSQFQPFTASAPAAQGNWRYSSGCYNTNGVTVDAPTNTSGSVALSVPVFNSATNDNGEAGVGKVWTDFWTVPVRYSDTYYPPIDTNATAQVYMNAQTNWVAYSGNGTGGYVTNELTEATTAGPNGYYQVSILSDYDTKKYSLLINGNCIGANLNFISTNTAVALDRWFVVQNFGGTTPCLFDEYRFTTNVSGVVTNEVPGGGISQADALVIFDTANPHPVVTNVTITGNTVEWRFEAEGIGDSIVLGGPSVNSISISKGSLPENGIINTADLNTTNKYFYRTVRQAGGIAITNSEIYGSYKQARQAGRSHIVGVPVIPVGSDATLGGPIGTQLASGLAEGDLLTIYAAGMTPQTYIRNAGPSWSMDTATNPASSMTLASGMGVLIKVVGSGGSAVLSGLLHTNAPSFALASNVWTSVAWPFETSGTISSAFGGSHVENSSPTNFASGDFAWIQQQGIINPKAVRYVNGAWRQYFNKTNGPLADSIILQAGDGILIHAAGSGSTWAPQ